MTYPVTDNTQIVDNINYLLSNLNGPLPTVKSINENNTVYFSLTGDRNNSYSDTLLMFPSSANATVLSPTIIKLETGNLAIGVQGLITINSNQFTFTVISKTDTCLIQLNTPIYGLTTFTANLSYNINISYYATDLNAIVDVNNSVVNISGYLTMTYGFVMSFYLNRYKVSNDIVFDKTLYKDDLSGSPIKFILPNIIDTPDNGKYLYAIEYSTSTPTNTPILSLKRGLNLITTRNK